MTSHPLQINRNVLIAGKGAFTESEMEVIKEKRKEEKAAGKVVTIASDESETAEKTPESETVEETLESETAAESVETDNAEE